MEANDCWKNVDATKQAKIEIKVWCLKLNVSTFWSDVTCTMLIIYLRAEW